VVARPVVNMLRLRETITFKQILIWSVVIMYSPRNFISPAGCQMSFITKPSDTAAVVRTSVIMNCARYPNEDLQWYFGTTLVASGNRARDDTKYALNRSTEGQFDLIVKNVQLADAGKYNCYFSSEETVSAEIIVIGEYQGLNCHKISGGLTSAYSLSLSLHTGNSALLTTAGVETDPQGIHAGHLVWGLSKQLRGSTPNPRQFKHW
jgi:hypothetical protein